jgi:2-methylcitrate dehydratase PrpD
MVMEDTVGHIVDFALRTRFEDLPEEVVHESKRILLDSIGCALAGLNTDKGKVAIEIARHMSGRAEATIVGTKEKACCMASAFSNGELINALDYDCVLPPGHVTPFVLPASLALAESVGATGKDLIYAIAIAHEISVRLARSMEYYRDFVNERVCMPSVYGYSSTIFGGTVSAGVMLRLDAERLANALGIAGYIAPVQALAKWIRTVPASSTKYLMAGWICEAEILSVLMAQNGYKGDTTVLDGEYGFWKYAGSNKWDPTAITEKLGESWFFPGANSFKPYPCCRVMHTGLDCLINIINEHDLKPEDIDGIKAYLEAFIAEPIWNNKRIETQMDAQMSVAYNFSVAAHRIKPGPTWQDEAVMRDPGILTFMEKITVEPHPGYLKTLTEDPSTRLSKVQVLAKGKIFSKELKYPKGSQTKAAYKMSDDELIEKFKENVGEVLPSHKIDIVQNYLLNIEELNISEVCSLLTR